MAVQDKFDIFVRYIRDSKRKIFSAAIIASIISVILFVAGSYWLLYHYYDSIVRDYYSSIMLDVSAFQQELIGRESYTEDLQGIAKIAGQHKGVKHVWFTNRFGTLIYSTDSELLEQYRKKRLPSDYYESIQWVWSFEGGYPDVHVIPIDRFLSLRYSIPLYAYGREDYEFVMGMDVKRFIYLPDNLSLLLPISIGYIVFFIALLFFPFFVWANSRFTGISTQAKVLFGSMEFDRGRSAIPVDLGTPKEFQPRVKEPTPKETKSPVEPAEEVKTKSPKSPKETQAPVGPEVKVKEKYPEDIKAPLETKASQETIASVEPKQEVKVEPKEETKTQVETKAPAEQQAKVKEESPLKPGEEAKEKPSLEIKKGAEADSLALFMEKRKDIFMKEDIELPFIHANSFVHHSKELGGSYIYTHRGKNALYFASFVLPYKKSSDALEHLDSMIQSFRQKMDDGKTLRELSVGLNNFCLDNNIELDLSVIAIYEDDRTVQYSSYGTGYSLYIKHDEDKVKELVLQMPKLGTVSNDKIDTIASFADVKFVQNDIFLLLPQNAAEIDIDGTHFVDIIKRDILSLKGQGAREITAHLSKPFKDKRDIPQTGFVVFKYI